MSSNLIFKVPGRTTTYLPIDVNMPREEIFQKFARGSFSTENEWPYQSPSAGYYDIKNSDTKLILLNNQKTWSHLRGKTKPKKEPFVKDPNYDWVEKEIEMKKAQELKPQKDCKDKRYPDPERHFLQTSCSHKIDQENEISPSGASPPTKTIKSFPGSRARTATKTRAAKEEESKENLENAMLIKYLYAIGPRTTGLQNKMLSSTMPKEFIGSYNLAHPEFTEGQKLFITNLCNVYSVSPAKKVKQEQYARLLEHQKEIDYKQKEKYRFNKNMDENFELYTGWFNRERPVQHQANCGYFSREFTNEYITSVPASAPITRAKSSRPRPNQNYTKKSEKSKFNQDSNEYKKKSNEEKLSDLNGSESYSSFPSPKGDSDL